MCDEVSARDYIKPPDFDSVDENYMPHYNSWDIHRVFDGGTSLSVRKIASSAHLSFIQGNLPDPSHTNIDIDPLCTASNMTTIDIKLARATVVADPRLWSSATTLAAAERSSSVIPPFSEHFKKNGVQQSTHPDGSSSGSSGSDDNEGKYDYPLEFDTNGHVVSPFNRFDPRYREKILCMTYTVQGYQGWLLHCTMS